ncbi:FMN-binding negative transcriptional regulator [Salipaludibacillus agaradhaerens]|uniref:FMN-binding negative transcriptional regulator n=1 Tax=Salipaludibacillus agaradhaerens TaxID=76935 RepID=UPI0021517228|nr:FMN-binding negative transcriptional regulator [Salipaludibacillus agaradhaerens]MCR6105664.1 FMN-binding negative transcriptional regulator [Salipaludibacillus agaradhaerens]MCR6117701.1 FMN-binding negative transcriptional regulator [Salipaludibacillus agaradhaerens]
MYIPKYFKVNNVDEIIDFVQKNSFGTIVTTELGKPIATHLPLQLIKEEDTYYITGHMSYGNPQWRTFDHDEDVLVMFQGPHAYISSSWYEKENVPTWNYQAVHIYGIPSILDEEELQQDLTMLLQKYENHRKNPVLWENLSLQTKKQLKGIVGFKIKVQEIQAANKLSQNRNEEDYYNIVNKLYEEKDINSQQMAQLMKRKFKQDK